MYVAPVGTSIVSAVAGVGTVVVAGVVASGVAEAVKKVGESRDSTIFGEGLLWPIDRVNEILDLACGRTNEGADLMKLPTVSTRDVGEMAGEPGVIMNDMPDSSGLGTDLVVLVV